MPNVLARVVTAGDAPRGPDVSHRIRAARAWLEEGAAVEFELPRHLTCAQCDGGGCDVCGRSGAITLRDRDEPPERVRVTLPRRSDSETDAPAPQAIVLRIPDQGGLSQEQSELPRGMLLLKVVFADEPDPGVQRVRRTEPPPEIVATEPSGSERRPIKRPRYVTVVAVLVVLWIALLIFLRVTGRG